MFERPSNGVGTVQFVFDSRRPMDFRVEQRLEPLPVARFDRIQDATNAWLHVSHRALAAGRIVALPAPERADVLGRPFLALEFGEFSLKCAHTV